jgi:RNA polymerase sigma-70 factor (ECF subfamily)
MGTGDTGALGAVYDRHAPALLAVAMRMLGAAREAQDVVHDVFLEAWEHAREYDAARASVRTWLLVRLRSRALDRLGRAEALRARSLEDAGDALIAWSARGAHPSEAVDALAVRQALEKIPEDSRRVLSLAYFDGLTAREIAERLGVPTGTVKSRRARGLASLASLLGLGGTADDA